MSSSSDEEDWLYLASSAAFVLELQPRRTTPRFWMREFLMKREEQGSSSLMNDLLLEDHQGFRNFIRMTAQEFEVLLEKVAPLIMKQDTNYRLSIPPADQLAVTLRYLATGDSYSSLMYLCRISKTKISECIPEVCRAIVQVLREYLKTPTTNEEWMKIAEDFEKLWNFPNCIGALDGKHVEIIKPENSGSEYFNYKKCFSIVLLALVDAHYNFIYVNVGVQGRISDGGVFNNTNLSKKIDNNEIGLPNPRPLPGRAIESPYVIVGDDAFALSKHLMKPYPGAQITGSPERIFNYRLSRARVTSENAFGVMTSKFRVLRQPILLCPQKATDVTLTCVYLHNFLRRSGGSSNVCAPTLYDTINAEGGIVPGSWRRDTPSLQPLQRVPRRDRATTAAIRNEFKEFFLTDVGRISWQDNYA